MFIWSFMAEKIWSFEMTLVTFNLHIDWESSLEISGNTYIMLLIIIFNQEVFYTFQFGPKAHRFAKTLVALAFNLLYSNDFFHLIL